VKSVLNRSALVPIIQVLPLHLVRGDQDIEGHFLDEKMLGKAWGSLAPRRLATCECTIEENNQVDSLCT
jgi:hypothetical protein